MRLWLVENLADRSARGLFTWIFILDSSLVLEGVGAVREDLLALDKLILL